jgi:hypothetical protein
MIDLFTCKGHDGLFRENDCKRSYHSGFTIFGNESILLTIAGIETRCHRSENQFQHNENQLLFKYPTTKLNTIMTG